MSSRLQKQAEKLLRKIEFEPAPLNNNKGPVIDDPGARRLTRKDRRHSGHRIVYADDEDYPIMFDSYDCWKEHRDGQRDKSKIIKNISPGQFHRSKWFHNIKFDEELYWQHRKERDKIRRMAKIRRIRKNIVARGIKDGNPSVTSNHQE